MSLSHPKTGVYVDPAVTPLRPGCAARLLGLSRWWVQAAKGYEPVGAGDTNPFGGGRFTTLSRLSAWIDAHPNFRADQYYFDRRQRRLLDEDVVRRASKSRRRRSTRAA